jgi:hypothetical protein
MSSWSRGEAEVEELLRRRELERITGTAADGSHLLARAGRTATTAAGLAGADSYSGYVLAYDAARFACVALLAQQGLRATSSGGHERQHSQAAGRQRQSGGPLACDRASAATGLTARRRDTRRPPGVGALLRR